MTGLFAITSFLSAFLLFQVQLIVSKHILPWFGGSAAVWTTSLLVFQILLLAGYIYAHVVSVRLRPTVQARLHGALLATAVLLILALSWLWPSAVTPGAAWKPLPGETPAREVAVIIAICAGLPFFVLSTTGPLLQSWFARLGTGFRTYKLYSVSNLGSLLGLLTFPAVIEPALRVQLQGRLWSLLFCLFACGCGLCAWQALKAAGPIVEDASEPAESAPQATPLLYALWFLLAACASALLLATTNLLCQEVITVPLLWVLPLSLYLLSFILCFDHPRWYKRAIFHALFVISLFLTCAALAFEQFLTQLLALPVLLFAACMFCHGELVRLKPSVRRLTSFYVAIAAGGAAGGIFVGVLAPRIFTSFVEFQLSLGVCLILLAVTLLRDSTSWIFRSDYRLPALIVGGALLAGYGGARWTPEVGRLLDDIRYYPVTLLIGIIVVMGAFVMKGDSATKQRGFRYVQILAAGIAILGFTALYGSVLPKPGLYLSSRSFYGVVRVFREAGSRQLVHGQTVHGGQLDPPMEHFPTTYYGPNSGIGVLLRNHPKRTVAPGTLRVGVVGLGVGTLAAYGLPGDYFRYYEINPDIVRLSSGESPVFTYVRDSAASIAVALGDARLSLERELTRGERQRFDVLVLDAFTGDAVPVHLLTKEAFETYWQQLDPETGVIAVHITSRHLDLVPVLQGAIAQFQADSVITFNRRDGPVFDSGWVLITRRPGLLQMPCLGPITVRYVHNVEPRLWTDDYSDVFRLIH